MRLIITIAICWCGLNLYGQINITGTLLDSDGNGLAYANIVSYRTQDSVLQKVFTTDESGQFNIELQEGSYWLDFSYVGFEVRRETINDSKNMGEVILTALAQSLDEVTVNATRPLLQRSNEKLIVNVENSILSTGNNTLEILQKSPGIIVDQDGDISLNGRNNVRIFLDGKDTRLGGDQLASLLEGMPASGIERIEIITNPSAKYEAQGNAGIIDIITKRGKLFGTNGSFSLTSGRGQYFRWDNNINFNHKTEKFNLYGQYSFAKRNQYMEIIIDRQFLDQGEVSSRVDMNTLFRLPIETHSPRLGIDYNLGEKSKIGVLLSGFLNRTGQESFAVIDAKDGAGDFLLAQITDADAKTNWTQYTSNLYFQHAFDNQSKLDVNVDWAKYNNSSEEAFLSTFFDNENVQLFKNSLLGNVQGDFQLLGLSGDYSKQLNEQQKIELGVKSTLVKTNNDVAYLDAMNGDTTLNLGLSNHFIYRENINATYFNYSIQKGKWNGSTGLRVENTQIEGEQITTDEVFDNDYTNFFPSFSSNYTFNPNNILGASISRRLDRPSYQDLNPFRFFVNTYTFRVGNPLLTPQYTWSYELNYTLKQRYFFSVNYALTIDNLDRAIFESGNEEVVVVAPINVDQVNSLAINASAPINFNKRWTSQWNASLSFNDYNGVIGGFDFERLNTILVLKTNHNINLGKGYTMQFGGFYLPAHWASVTKINDISQISLGFQKRILENRGSLRLNANDIFYQGFPSGRTLFGTIDDRFISKRDSRYVSFTFSLNFGKQSVRAAPPRRSAVQEEMRRARQSGG